MSIADDLAGLDLDELRKESARCIVEVQTFCFCIQETLIDVYSLQAVVKSRVNMEQLENFVTALVLEGQIYIFLYNLKALSEFDQLQKLTLIVQNAQVNLANLQIDEVFQLSEEYKNKVVGENKEKRDGLDQIDTALKA